MNDSPSLFLIKVEDFLFELCGSVVSMSSPSVRTCEGEVRAFCRSPETSSRVTLALLGNVFQTIPRLFSS